MTRFLWCLTMLAWCGCASRGPPRLPAGSADALLAGAIARAGGAAALERAGALSWDGDARVFVGGRTVSITGNWRVQPPDTAVVTTYDISRGPGTRSSLVVAAPRGWFFRGGTFTAMPSSVLANERDEFYLYSVMRLVLLRDPSVSRSVVAPDSLGQRGFRVQQPGRPAVDAFVDASGRLAHLRAMIADPGSGNPVKEDLWLEGSARDGGVLWPARLRITLADAPYFELTIRSLRVLDRLDDQLLRGPP